MFSVHKLLTVISIILFSFAAAAQEKTNQSNASAEIEGLVLNVSKLADPKKSDYPDCHYIVEFEVKNIISGAMTSRVINLSVPGFINYRLTPYKFKNGDKIRCNVVHSDSATEKEKATQACDDFSAYERDTYFLRAAKYIHEWSALSMPHFINQEKYVSAWDEPFNPPQTAESIRLRAAAIRKDLEYVKSQAGNQVDSAILQKCWSQKSAELPKFNSSYFWFQRGNGVFALPKNIRYYVDYDVSPAMRKSIKSLIALNKYLRKQNVDLILVLYPDCFSVALKAFFEDVPNLLINPNSQIAGLLLENDVEVIDLAPHLTKLLSKSEFLFYYYHLNQHPGWDTQDLAGKLVAERLKRYNIPAVLNPELFVEKKVFAGNKDYVYPHNLPIGNNVPGQPIMTYATFYNNLPTPVKIKSPVLLWGNSFLDWPKNQAFMTAVAKYHLNFCERQHSAGCFTSMIRDMCLNPKQYIKDKRAMVVPIAVTMLRDRKVWNIADMDEQFNRRNRLAESFDVPLPEGGAIPKNIEKQLRKYNVKVRCYSLSKDALHIVIPKIKMQDGLMYYMNITYCNELPVYCSYDGKDYPIAAPAQFTIETLTAPYNSQCNEIAFYSKEGKRNILISGIKIEGYKK